MSNLLEKASIILTPTAYDNSKVLCVKPSDGSGDFDFSRNSAATRVNAQGLVENVQSLSSNLVTNGDFATDSNWNKNSNWSIGGNVANCDGTSNGDINQGTTLATIGKSYEISYEVVSISQGEFFFKFGGVNGTLRNSIGVYTETIQAINTNRIALDSSNNAIGSVTNISVKEVIDNTNLPRINYEGGCGSWLFEPQSTNLIEYSNDYADAYWIKSTSGSGIAPIVTSNYAISPDGTQNADRIQFDATTSGSNSDRSRIRTTLTLSDVTDYTFSFYAKSTDGTDQKISILFDNSQISVKTITSEWKRFEATSQQTGTSSICGLDLRGGNASTSDILVYGIQVEQLSYATSYIPTDGSTVTRNQDLCTNGATGTGLINSTEGVLYAEIAANSNDLTYRIFSINDGSRNNRVYLQYTNASNTLAAVVKSSNNTQANMTLVVSDETNFIKVGFKYKANDFALWVNGVEVGTDTSGLSPIGLNNLAFNDGTSNNFFGKTKALAVFPYLSDSELQSLTTI